MKASDALAAFFVRDDGRVILEMEGFPDLELGRSKGLQASRDGDELDWMLTLFRSRVSNLRPPLDDLAAAFASLNESAAVMAHRLVDDDVSLLLEIHRRFTDAWPHWRTDSEALPVVEIIGHDALFPFEFLRVFDLSPHADFVNHAEAHDAFRSFLGFSAVVRRVTPETNPVEPLARAPTLPIQVLRFDMDGALEEDRYFGDASGMFEIDGSPYPELAGVDRVARVVDALYDPALRLDGTRRTELPAQIHHFACHCDTTDPSDTQYFFTLGREDDPTPCNVSLGTLRAGFFARLTTMEPCDVRPLVVMNACGSSTINVRTAGSFPNWFLRQRHRAFVGTETEIPDAVAAAFSARLYDELAGGAALGEALVRARTRLMAEEQSPLGLLYVMYGDPSLTVVDQAQASVRACALPGEP